MRLPATLTGIVCAASVIAGCGGGDDNTLTKAEFTQQSEAICKKASAKREAAVVAALKTEDPKDEHGIPHSEKTIAEAGIPALSQMTEELSDLGAPEAGEEEVTAIVDSFEAGVKTMEEDPRGSLRGDNPSFPKAVKLAAAFGLESCGQL